MGFPTPGPEFSIPLLNKDWWKGECKAGGQKKKKKSWSTEERELKTERRYKKEAELEVHWGIKTSWINKEQERESKHRAGKEEARAKRRGDAITLGLRTHTLAEAHGSHI